MSIPAPLSLLQQFDGSAQLDAERPSFDLRLVIATRHYMPNGFPHEQQWNPWRTPPALLRLQRTTLALLLALRPPAWDSLLAAAVKCHIAISS